MRRIGFILLGISCLGGLGCSFAGGGLTLFPEDYQLLESTKAVVQPVPPAIPTELNKQPLAPYRVEPGDVLVVQAVGSEEEPIILPGEQPVIQDGTIDLGAYGRPMVAGRTLAEIEQIASAAIANSTEVDRVTVQLVTRVSKMYYVLGEVINPGSFQLEGRETVLDGILAAGGLSGKADVERVILTRPTPADSCREVFPVCYNNIVQLGDTTTNYQLAPGDRIFVSSRQLFGFLKKDEHWPCDASQYPCVGPGLDCAACAAPGVAPPVPVEPIKPD